MKIKTKYNIGDWVWIVDWGRCTIDERINVLYASPPPEITKHKISEIYIKKKENKFIGSDGTFTTIEYHSRKEKQCKECHHTQRDIFVCDREELMFKAKKEAVKYCKEAEKQRRWIYINNRP